MKSLFILNHSPYANEIAYNALRLAGALAKRDHNSIHIYLMGDAVLGAKAGQTGEGQIHIEKMFENMMPKLEGKIGVCSGCMDSRGVHDDDLVTGTHRGTLEELANWSEWAEKILTF